MDNHIVEILWTGGFDSTYRAWKLSRMPVTVRSYYVSDDRKTEENECSAVDKVIEILERDPRTKCTFERPVRIKKSERKFVKTIHDIYMDVIRNDFLGSQYDWLAAFATDHRGVELCVHVDDKAILYINKYGKLLECEDEITGRYAVVDKENSSKDVVMLFGDYRLPLFDLTKVEMRRQFIEEGCREILETTWFCYSPVRGKPCGCCNPCMYTIDEGMVERMGFESIRRYSLRKKYNEIEAGGIAKAATQKEKEASKAAEAISRNQYNGDESENAVNYSDERFTQAVSLFDRAFEENCSLEEAWQILHELKSMGCARFLSENGRELKELFIYILNFVREMLGVNELPQISVEEAGKDTRPLAIVVCGSVMGTTDAATIRTFFTAYRLQHEDGYRVMIINDGSDNFYRSDVLPNFAERRIEIAYNETKTVSFEGETFEFLQNSMLMPNLDVLKALVEGVYEMQPALVVNVGGMNLLGDLCSGFTKTLCAANEMEEPITVSEVLGQPLQFIRLGSNHKLSRESLSITDDRLAVGIVGDAELAGIPDEVYAARIGSVFEVGCYDVLLVSLGVSNLQPVFEALEAAIPVIAFTGTSAGELAGNDFTVLNMVDACNRLGRLASDKDYYRALSKKALDRGGKLAK